VNQGTTFLRTDSDKHLWIVLSDPTRAADQVLLVNMTTLDERKEQICVLNVGDHPWITHATCINYGDAVLTTLDKLLSAKDAGALKLQDPLAAHVLQRILAAVPASERIALEYAELLQQQGFVEF
jgi:hypothetical protein